MKKYLVFIFILLSGVLYAASTTTVIVDIFKSSDRTKTWTPPAATDTLVGRVSTDTLTNKSMSGSSNTFTNISLTSSVTGTLPVGNGGTGQTSLTSHGVLVGNGSSGISTTATGSSGQLLQSNGSGSDPSYTTATYPSTTTANQILYSSATNAIGQITTAATSALVTNSSSVPSLTSGSTANRLLRTDGTTVSFAQAALATDVSGTLPFGNGGTGQTSYTDGQLLIGNTATGGISKSTLTAGSNITITNGNGSISIAASGGGSGSVTSVDFSVPATSILSVSGNPITTSGTIALATTGTSGGIPYFSSTSQLTSSGLLATKGVVLGGGAGAAPTTLATSSSTAFPLVSGGTNTAPSWAGLTVAGGGTGAVSLTNHGVLLGQSTSAIVATAAGSSGQVLQSGGASADPGYSTATWPTGAITSPAVVVFNTTSTGTALTGSTANRLLRTNGSSLSFSQVDLTVDITGVLSASNGGDNAIYTSTSASTYTATATDETILVDTSGGAKTVALPTAVGISGRKYRIINGSNSNPVTIDPNSTETVCGQLVIKLSGLYDSIELVSDGANWQPTNANACWVQRAAKITCSASSSIVSQQQNWLSTVGNFSGGVCSITVNAGMWSSTPQGCWITGNGGANLYNVQNLSTTNIDVGCVNTSVVNCTTATFHITCLGPR